MRRLASEVLRSLEQRVARLEKQAKFLISSPTTTTQLFKVEGSSVWKYIFRGLKKIGVLPKEIVIESLEVQGDFDPVSELYEAYVLIFSIPSRGIENIELVWGGPASLMNPKVKPSVEYNGRIYPAGKGGGTGYVKTLELIIFNEADVLRSREEAKRLKSLERAKAREEAKVRKEKEEREEREYQERERRRNAPPTLDQIRRVIERMDSYHNVHIQGNKLEVDLEYRYKDDYTDEDMEIQERNYARFEKDLLKACPKLKKYWNKQVEMILQDKGFLSIIFDSSYMQLLK